MKSLHHVQQILIFHRRRAQIQESDALPKNVCFDCRHQLEKSYYFRLKSRNTDTKLRRHLRLISTGKASNVFETAGGEDDQHEDDYIESREFFAKWECDQNEADRRRADATDQIVGAKVAAALQNERLKMCAEETKRIFERARKHFAAEKERLDKVEQQTVREIANRISSTEYAPPLPQASTSSHGERHDDIASSSATDDDHPMDDAMGKSSLQADIASNATTSTTQKFFDLVEKEMEVVDFKVERASSIDSDDEEAESLLMRAEDDYFQSGAAAEAADKKIDDSGKFCFKLLYRFMIIDA